MAEHRPYWRSEAVVWLADLRRRQGRLAEAEELFAQAAAHPFAMRGLGELNLDRGEPAPARDLLERCLRRVPEESRLVRAWPLEVLVRALVALGERESASARVDELSAIAAAIPTPPLRATMQFTEGLLAAATADYERARLHLEDAIDLLEACRTPLECARAHLELARTLNALGRTSTAEAEARAALTCADGIARSSRPTAPACCCRSSTDPVMTWHRG